MGLVPRWSAPGRICVAGGSCFSLIFFNVHRDGVAAACDFLHLLLPCPLQTAYPLVLRRHGCNISIAA